METVNNECKELIQTLYEEMQPKMEKLVFLELVNKNYIDQDTFFSQMIDIHQEIRKASTNKFRYFVNMKLGKLVKDIKSPLPLSEYLSLIDNDTCHTYWKTVHQLYALLESECKDKNEPYINTLVSEVDRRDNVKALEAEQVELRHKKMAENAEKRLTIQQDRANLPDIDEFINQLDSNPEMMEAVAMMTGQNMSTKEMKHSLKQAMKSNPQMINMIKGAMSMANNDGAEMDLMGMLEQFIPDIDMNCHTNIVLVNKIYNDMLYIFEGDTVKERMIEKAQVYKDLIGNNRITISEIIACMWKITNDEEKFNSIQNISTEHLNMDTLMAVALEFIPTDMLDKLGDLEALKNMMSSGDMGGMGDIMKMFKGKMNPEIEEELTEEQLKELEEFYNSMK